MGADVAPAASLANKLDKLSGFTTARKATSYVDPNILSKSELYHYSEKVFFLKKRTLFKFEQENK